MQAKDIIGKTITDIFIFLKQEPAGLDYAECYLEIDKSFFVQIPYFEDDEILVEKADERAVSIFSLSGTETIYHVNKEKKTIEDIAKKKGEERRAFFRQIGGHLKKMASLDEIQKEYKPNKTETIQNRLFEIKNTKIIDFIWDTEEDKKGLFFLSNGFIITDIPVAPNGLGTAGLHYFENMEKLVNSGRYDYGDLERITYDLP